MNTEAVLKEAHVSYSTTITRHRLQCSDINAQRSAAG